MPVAATLNVALCPEAIVAPCGCVEIAGAVAAGGAGVVGGGVGVVGGGAGVVGGGAGVVGGGAGVVGGGAGVDGGGAGVVGGGVGAVGGSPGVAGGSGVDGPDGAGVCSAGLTVIVAAADSAAPALLEARTQ